jgi:hypothetical protein
MSSLEFSRSASTITLLAATGETVGQWDAANFVDSHSDGPWPAGTYNFDHCGTHADDAPNSAYGSNGIFVFNVPNRTGMGVHSGRRDIADGAGRSGFRHCTEGCIRTTDEATAQILATHGADPLSTIDVG